MSHNSLDGELFLHRGLAVEEDDLLHLTERSVHASPWLIDNGFKTTPLTDRFHHPHKVRVLVGSEG